MFSRVCIGFFFLRWSACPPAVAVCVLGGKIFSVACPFPVKNVTVPKSRFYQFSITIALRISAKKDIFPHEEMEKCCYEEAVRRQRVAETGGSRKGKMYGQKTPALAPAARSCLWVSQEGKP